MKPINYSNRLHISILRELTFTSTRFTLYEPFRAIFEGKERGREASLSSKILSGLTSGAIAAAIFNPTDVLKIRFQADVKGTRYKSLLHGIRTMYKEEGIKGFYKGVSTTIFRAAILTSAQFSSYDHSKHILIKYFDFSDNLLTHFTFVIQFLNISRWKLTFFFFQNNYSLGVAFFLDL